MSTQVLFGKGGVNAPQSQSAVAAAPMPQAAPQPGAHAPAMDAKTYYEQINAGTVKSVGPYAAGKSLIVAGLLWFFIGNFGAHRYYLGHYIIGAIQTCLAIFSIYNIISLGKQLYTDLGPGATEAQMEAWIHANLSNLGIVFGVMVVFGLWVLFDFIYIIIRKVTSN